MSINKVILIGRLGQNPEVRYTGAGMAVANFNVATNETWNDKAGQKQERTEWHKIVVWGKLAELCGQYLTKGRQVYLEGKLQTRQWQDKEGQTRYTTEVQGATVQFLGGGNPQTANQNMHVGVSPEASSAPAPQNAPLQEPGFAPSSSFTPSFTEDDIPF